LLVQTRFLAYNSPKTKGQKSRGGEGNGGERREGRKRGGKRKSEWGGERAP